MKKLAIGLIVAGVLACGIARAENAEAEKRAVAAAEAWLKLVDDGKYAESWGQAAEYFRNALTEEQWDQSLQAVRTPLGKLLSRKVLSTDHRTEVPGAPDGEYVIIQFQASFENKKSATETVTPMLEKDGKWHVSGYYIK